MLPFYSSISLIPFTPIDYGINASFFFLALPYISFKHILAYYPASLYARPDSNQFRSHVDYSIKQAYSQLIMFSSHLLIYSRKISNTYVHIHPVVYFSFYSFTPERPPRIGLNVKNVSHREQGDLHC